MLAYGLEDRSNNNTVFEKLNTCIQQVALSPKHEFRLMPTQQAPTEREFERLQFLTPDHQSKFAHTRQFRVACPENVVHPPTKCPAALCKTRTPCCAQSEGSCRELGTSKSPQLPPVAVAARRSRQRQQWWWKRHWRWRGCGY